MLIWHGDGEKRLTRLVRRDPDPLWRWASGGYQRSWLRRPLTGALVGCALIFTVWGATTLHAYRGATGANPWARAMEAGAMTASLAALALLAIQFVVVAARPFQLLSWLGGPSILRQLRLSAQSPERIGRILFWGSYRAAALPWLILLYFTYALLWVCVSPRMGGHGGFVETMRTNIGHATPAEFQFLAISPVPTRPWGLGRRYETAAVKIQAAYTLSFLAWFLVKPLLDPLLNLALAWWLVFRTGGRRLGVGVLLAVILIGFPGLGRACTALLFEAATSMASLMGATAGVFVLGTCGAWMLLGRSLRRRGLSVPLASILLGAAAALAAMTGATWLMDALAETRSGGIRLYGHGWRWRYGAWTDLLGPWIALGLKGWIALLCHRDFLRGWPRRLEENFPDSG